MASSTSFRPTTPFHQSTNHAHIPRSKTPNPIREKRPAAEPLKRSRTPVAYSTEDEGGPWRQTVNTYTWVMEHQYAEIRRREMQARAATVETRVVEPEWASGNGNGGHDSDRRFWDEKAYTIDIQARMWMLQEEARRIAALREAERTRVIQEEVRKIQARIQMRREIERQRISEERRVAYEEMRDRERRQRATLDKTVANAWRVYESRWTAILSSSESLSFRTIPWPVLVKPASSSSLTIAAISSFLLSPAHSTSQTPKERIKEGLRRWHPDRFGRLLSRVPEAERAIVEEAVGIVVRCLNELLSRQPSQAQPTRPL